MLKFNFWFLQQPVSQTLARNITSVQVEADFPEAIRPSTSRRSFDSEKTSVGRGKAGRYKLVQNKMIRRPGDTEPEVEKESVREKWKTWNLQHQAKMKKEVARYTRQGVHDVTCKACKRTISVDKYFKHNCTYNYCKGHGYKYLKFENFKKDYPNIDI